MCVAPKATVNPAKAMRIADHVLSCRLKSRSIFEAKRPSRLCCKWGLKMGLKNQIFATAAGVVLSGLLWGCNFDDNSLPSGPTVQSDFAAICELSNEAGFIVCEDMQTNTPTNNTGCTTTEKSNYSAEGAIGASYLAPTGSNVFVSCADNVPTAVVGSCTLSDRVIRYYTGAWTATTAQSDCTGRGGQW